MSKFATQTQRIWLVALMVADVAIAVGVILVLRVSPWLVAPTEMPPVLLLGIIMSWPESKPFVDRGMEWWYFVITAALPLLVLGTLDEAVAPPKAIIVIVFGFAISVVLLVAALNAIPGTDLSPWDALLLAMWSAVPFGQPTDFGVDLRGKRRVKLIVAGFRIVFYFEGIMLLGKAISGV